MRKIRNPRYAPEFLERKLSPSAVMGGMASVAVYQFASSGSEPSPGGPNDPMPVPGTGTPDPTPPPSNPTGPVGPA